MLLEGNYPKESDKRAAEQAARETALQEQKAAEEARMESLLNPQCILTSKMKDIM
jgi:cell division protein FtsB